MADDPDVLPPLIDAIPAKPLPNPGFIGDMPNVYEPPEDARALDYMTPPPPFGQAFGEMVTQSSPLAWLGRAVERGTQQGASGFDRGLVSAGNGARSALDVEAGIVPNAAGEPVQSEMLTADEANKRYAPEGSKITDGPIPDGLARIIGRQKIEELRRNSILARSNEANAWPVNFGTGMAAFMLDPLNLATNFVPGLGEAAMAAAAGRGVPAIMRIAQRGVAGAVSMAAIQAPLSALEFGLGREEASDFGFRDALYQVFMGAAVGAAFHAGFGGLREAGLLRPDHIMRPPEEAPPALGGGAAPPAGPTLPAGEALGRPEPGRTVEPEPRPETVQAAPVPADAATVSLAAHDHADAMRVAVAEVLDERAVDVTPVLDQVKPPAEGSAATPAEVAAHQQDLRRDGHVTGIPDGDLRAATAAVYGPEVHRFGEPPKLPPILPMARIVSPEERERMRIEFEQRPRVERPPPDEAPVFHEVTPEERARALATNEPPIAPPTRPADYGANNKLVTTAEYEVIRARMRARASQLNTGIDPEMMLDGARLAVYHIEAGARAFGAFGREMLADIGQEARPYLRSWYEAARHWPGLDAGGMSTVAEIEAGAGGGGEHSSEIRHEPAPGPRLVSDVDAEALRGRLPAKAAGLRADAEMAEAERMLAEIMPHLSDEERAEIDATGARMAEADDRAAGYAGAAVCLRAA